MRKLALLLVVLVAAGYAAITITLDFSGDALGRSLAGETGAEAYFFGCGRTSRARWRCTLLDQGDSGASYFVRRIDGKCWRARRMPRSDRGPAFPATTSGCVDALEAVGDALGFGPEQYD